MRKALYLIIFVKSVSGFSQDRDVLRGIIVTDSLQSNPVNIINLTKGIGTINDHLGFFQIQATKGDTIIFSSVQHKQKTHIVAKKDLERASLSIQLEIKINELEEVTISQYDLTGKVKEDVKKIKTYEDNLPIFNAKMLDETPFIHEKGVNTIKNRVIIDEMDATPVNFIAVGRMIASLFRKKDVKKLKEVRVPEVSDFYNQDFLVDELKIPETEVYNFLDFLNQKVETKHILRSGDELRILEYLMNQSSVFNNENPLKTKD